MWIINTHLSFSVQYSSGNDRHIFCIDSLTSIWLADNPDKLIPLKKRIAPVVRRCTSLIFALEMRAAITLPRAIRHHISWDELMVRTIHTYFSKSWGCNSPIKQSCGVLKSGVIMNRLTVCLLSLEELKGWRNTYMYISCRVSFDV